MTARAMTWGTKAGLPEPSARVDDRAGHEVPGYTGYIPGKVPEMDIVGGTFAKVNQHVAFNDRTASGPLGVKSTPLGVHPSPRTDAFMGSGVPGYTGYIPGKIPEADVFGKTFADANAHVLVNGRPPTGHGQGPWEGPPPPKHADVAKARAKVPGAAHAMVSIPGYTGFVPSKKAENVHGHSFSPANQKAAKEFHKVTYRPDGGAGKASWRRTSGPGVEDRRNQGAGPGIAIPGYSGHAPGKKPEADMMGMTFAEVNKHADKQHRIRRGKLPEDHGYGHGGYPCPSAASMHSGVSTRSPGGYSHEGRSSAVPSAVSSRHSARESHGSRPASAPSMASTARSSAALGATQPHARPRTPGSSRAASGHARHTHHHETHHHDASGHGSRRHH